MQLMVFASLSFLLYKRFQHLCEQLLMPQGGSNREKPRNSPINSRPRAIHRARYSNRDPSAAFVQIPQFVERLTSDESRARAKKCGKEISSQLPDGECVWMGHTHWPNSKNRIKCSKCLFSFYFYPFPRALIVHLLSRRPVCWTRELSHVHDWCNKDRAASGRVKVSANKWLALSDRLVPLFSFRQINRIFSGTSWKRDRSSSVR